MLFIELFCGSGGRDEGLLCGTQQREPVAVRPAQAEGGILFRRRHGWGSRSDEAGPPDGPKPNNNRDNDNPEPKPQAACLLARLHEEIIRPTGRANQGEGRHTTRIPTNSLDSLHTALH